MSERRLAIREVAERTGLTAHTLRYYERIGLVEPVARATGGQRRYREDEVGWLELLTCLRDSGMPIREMQRFAALVRQGPATNTARRELLEAHQEEVRRRQRELAGYLGVIDDKIAWYRDREEESV